MTQDNSAEETRANDRPLGDLSGLICRVKGHAWRTDDIFHAECARCWRVTDDRSVDTESDL